MNTPSETDDKLEAERAYGMRLFYYEDLRRERNITYSKQHLRRLIAAGKFPPPIYTSQRRMAWPAFVIDAWIKQKADEAATRPNPLRSADEYRQS